MKFIDNAAGGAGSGLHADLTDLATSGHPFTIISGVITDAQHGSRGSALHADSHAAAPAHHANTNDPTTDEKAALGGTNGVPSGANRYVTNTDPRNTDSRNPLAHTLVGALHTIAGGVAGHVLRVTGAATYALQQLNHTDINLDGVHPNDHAAAPAHHAELHNDAHEPGGADAMAVDAAAAIGSLRTLGVGAAQAAPGNHGPHSSGGGVLGTAVLDFGANPAEEASIVVADAGIDTLSHVEAWFQRDTTADNNVDEHEQAAFTCPLICGDIIDATSFKITAKPQLGFATGQFTVHWRYS